MADIKKIRFYDLSELEIYDISDSNNYLTIKFLKMNLSELITKFTQAENISKIEYYVNDILIQTYQGFIVYVSAGEVSSGMVEITNNIQSITVRKKTLEERVQALEEREGI